MCFSGWEVVGIGERGLGVYHFFFFFFSCFVDRIKDGVLHSQFVLLMF